MYLEVNKHITVLLYRLFYKRYSKKHRFIDTEMLKCDNNNGFPSGE